MKKTFASGFILSLILASCSAVKPTKYLDTISSDELKTHLYIVAGDEMEGRNTGEPGQKKAGKYLISQYEKMGVSYPKEGNGWYQKVPSEFMVRAFSPKLNDSENIWAFIEGSEKPEEILVISAHYDHVGMKNGEVYNGADDDGSGTVALLEIAKAFQQAKKEGHGPKRSVLFLHVTGEEHGLHGSRYYAEHPLFPLDNGNYVYLIGSDRLSTDLHNISEEANKKYSNLELDYKYNDRNDPEKIYYRSDHYNFAKNGIPSLFYFNGVHEDYHLSTDTPDKIEYDLLQKRTKLVFATAWELANRKERIKVDRDGK